jgi:CubicO group peptidase (beta-lactamase class C family)
LLTAEEMRPALTPVKLNDGMRPKWPATPGGDNLSPGNPVSYGFGWFLDPYRSHVRMWHFGSTTGFATAIDRFTKDRLTIIILCNRTDVDPAKLALQVADIIFDSK